MLTHDVTIIAALSRSRGIGWQGGLLYWLPDDLKRFKALTTGHTVVMGRKTFESLPHGALPRRRNLVLSRAANARFEGAECFHSLADALAHCTPDEEVFVIGGASVYAEALPVARRLCLTAVDDDSRPADAYFPDFSAAEWHEVSREARPADERHAYPFCFIDYERRDS